MPRIFRPGRSTQSRKNEPTTDLYIPMVLDKTACVTHDVPVGMPCWRVPRGSGYYAAICNARARSAGFSHEISETSMSRSKPKTSKNS